MAQTPEEKVSERYQAAHDLYHDNADFASPPNLAKAQNMATAATRLIALTPAMSAIDQERVSFSIEHLEAMRKDALRIGNSRGRVVSYEHAVSRP